VLPWALAACFLATTAVVWFIRPTIANPPTPPWPLATLFNPPNKPVEVVVADVNYGMTRLVDEQPVTLERYLSPSYRSGTDLTNAHPTSREARMMKYLSGSLLTSYADLVVVASPSIGSETILIARKGITSPADLKGKRVAVGSLAGPALLTLKIVLKSYGLNSEDVNYIVTGPTASRYAALNSGVADATLLTPPFSLYAKKAGYTLFDNLAAMKEIEFANASIITTKKFAQQEPVVVEAVLKSIVEGLHVYKTNAAETLPILRKYLKIQNPDELQYVYKFYDLVAKPYPSMKSVKLFLDWSKYPKAKTSDPKQFVDPSFVDKLDRIGVFVESSSADLFAIAR
jgi:ABC-type nitrate/sulfonate/bicarbonate transport system substrate-binding protein